MQPKVLMLDEPIAGLDPYGRQGILDLVRKLHGKGVTIIMASHNMDDLARISERIIIMSQAKVYLDGTPREVFSRVEEIVQVGLEAPYAARVAHELRLRGKEFPEGIITVGELERAIVERVT
jgi:energy-coupling factor transport system ATP-binding protein